MKKITHAVSLNPFYSIMNNNHGGKRKGAGRKPKGYERSITIRCRSETLQKFINYCNEKNVSQSKAFEIIMKNPQE